MERLAPVQKRLKLAKEKVQSASEKEKEHAEAELSKLELENPEVALYSVLAARAAKAEEGSYDKWRWSRLAEEIERVDQAATVVAAPLDRPLNEVLAEEEDEAWKARSRALSELQYWTLRGNRKAELALVTAVRQHAGTWVAQSADDLLRQAWGMHADAHVNALMCRAKEALKQKDASTALKAFAAAADRAAAADGGRIFAEAHRWIALTYDKALGNAREARRAYEAALRAAPNNYAILLEAGRLFHREAQAGEPTKPESQTHSETIANWLAGHTPLSDDAIAAKNYLDRALALNPALQADILKLKYNLSS